MIDRPFKPMFTEWQNRICEKLLTQPIYVTIDNIEYVIVEDRSSPYSNDISKIIKKGSNVSFSYEKKSKFIFDISKADTTYESFLGDVSIVFANSIKGRQIEVSRFLQVSEPAEKL